MKKLNFKISIKAPKEVVWNKMIGQETYRVWTNEFCEGSDYIGSWDEGAKIKFIDPRINSGMVSEIAINKPFETISIRHLGMINNGVEDFDSPEVKSWAPSYENYYFSENGEGTDLNVEIEMAEKYEDYMNTTWPKALEKLKEICE